MKKHDTITVNGKKLEIERWGKRAVAYDGNGVGCIETISRRIEYTADGEAVEIRTQCGKPLYRPAIEVRLGGCRVLCRECLERRHQEMGETLEQAIENRRQFNEKIANGELVCDVCGSRGARPCPGEGQNLCSRCNKRAGINRWS